MENSSSFNVQRTDLRSTHWAPDDAANAPLAAGQVRLRIASFALTSNNITYAAFGEVMKYWEFFPSAVSEHGRIPVWGFADVVAVAVDGVDGVKGVAVGERFYGYFPMAHHVLLQPVRVTAAGFSDGAAHRRELHPVYNHYSRCSTDPGYRSDQEAQIAILRPLFTTSFLIDDFLADNAFFGARSVVLSSASSKTAYGTAFCLAQRRDSATAVKVVGLTSPANLAFTRGLGCYDEVLAYDAITSLPAEVPTVYVDFSGSAAVRLSMHAHFQDALAYSCAVGGTHWDALGGGHGLPGPKPTLFFAPTQIKKRNADWGAAELQQRIGAAWVAFMARTSNPQSPWLTVQHGHGPAAVEAVYRSLLDGRSDPQQGHMLSL